MVGENSSKGFLVTNVFVTLRNLEVVTVRDMKILRFRHWKTQQLGWKRWSRNFKHRIRKSQ